MGFQIGAFNFPKGIWAAPLEGITDDPIFRLMCRINGAELTFVPMVSISDSTRKPDLGGLNLSHARSESPFAIQVLGNANSHIKLFFENLSTEGVGIIDLNLCCSARSALINNMGGALLRKPGKAAAFAEEVIKYSPVPVTAKMRSSWSREFNYGAEIARELEYSGIAAITVHGCSVKAKYTVPSNPKYIKEIRETVNVPVIANGDIRTPEDMTQVLNMTGAAGVMIGRASIGNPCIFSSLTCNETPPFASISREIKPLWLLLDYVQSGKDHILPVDLSAAKHFLYVHLKDAARKQLLRDQLDAINTLEDFLTFFVPKYPELARHPLAKKK